jgi:serine protease Do
MSMINENNIIEWAERFLAGKLHADEQAIIKALPESDPALHRRWLEQVAFMRTMAALEERNDMRNLISSVAAQTDSWKDGEEVPATSFVPRRLAFLKYVRTTAIAASLVLCSSLATMFFMNKKVSKADQKNYIELVRKVNTIEASQSKIIDSLKKVKGEHAGVEEAANQALFGGTGFALTNDGYIATNYHVVKNANAIYVQTNKGEDLEAYIVSSVPGADIAILKLVDKNYRFGKTPIPYNIAKPASGLGQRVFTIGYPKDEVVYNEGYISCEKGYEGDVHSYQLEMTANPGQSGSPVFDKHGSVIALITGKQNNTSGTTFAVHSDALIELVHSLPSSKSIRLPEHNRLQKLERTEQVKRMRDYVFSIKVK